jgi:DNA-binding MarR family transcriptional regulator
MQNLHARKPNIHRMKLSTAFNYRRRRHYKHTQTPHPMKPLAHASARSDNTARNCGPSPTNSLKILEDRSNQTPSSPMEMLDSIFIALRATKMSVNAFHAIIKLHLEAANKKGNLTLSGLASKLGITTAAITGIADSIESLGFARRVVDPSDRRVIQLELTSRGSNLAETFYTNTMAKN